MYCSSIFVFSLVVLINILSSGATNGDSNNRHPHNSIYEMSQRNKRQEETLNIGNGFNRRNVISISPNPGSQPDLGYRFGGGTQNAQQPHPGQQRSVSNIGNGSQNRNIVSVNSGGRTPQTQSGAPNARNNGRTSFVSPSITRRFNVGYGQDNQNNVIVNGQRIQPAAPVSNGGRTSQTQSSARNTGGTSFVSPDGAHLFNVGYGKDNKNRVIVNGQRIQPAVPVSNGGRTFQAQGNAGNARNSYGHEANINPVYLNGKVLPPAINDGQYSTYYTNGQTIKVLNSGTN